MKTYKVWIEVESHDDETDEYDEVDLTYGSLGEFATEEQALEFAASIQAQHQVN